MFLDIILASSLAAFSLFIWFKTNVVYEYARLFKLNNIKIFKEYEEFIKITYLDFAEFLGMKSNFICKLVSCPLCLNFWLNILLLFIFKFEWQYIGLLYIISIIEYMIVNIIKKYDQN